MGTRNLTVVILDGKHRVAQYGQWSGYPSGQGATIAYFLTTADLDAFRKAVSDCSYLTAHEQTKLYEGCLGHPLSDEWLSLDESSKLDRAFPHLSRDAGGKILQLVLDGHRQLQDNYDFAADSLFCEWAYVVDLDTNHLEVYQGFNREPLAATERFASLKPEKDPSEYYPVRMVLRVPFHELYDDTMSKLEQRLNEEEEAAE